MRKIELKKTVEEFEINGNVYQMDTKDDKMMEYIKEHRKLVVELEKVQSREPDEDNPEEVERYMDDMKTLLERVFVMFFGKGSFARLYDDCGGSVYNLLIVLEHVGDFLEGHLAEAKAKQREKYQR